MNRRMKTTKIQIRFTGKTGEIDGVMEMVIGALVMTGVLVNSRDSVTQYENGMSKIYVEAEVLTPPLGNLGEKGMHRYEGDNP